MSTTETALTVHLVRPCAVAADGLLATLRHDLHHKFGIAHCTIQVEFDNSTTPCPQAPADVVIVSSALPTGLCFVETANLAGRAVDQQSVALGDLELADTAHRGNAPLAGDDRSVARHPTAPAHDRRCDPHRRLVLGAGFVDEQYDVGAPFPGIERRRGVAGDLSDTDAGRCGEAHPEQNTVGRRTDRGRRDPEDHVVDQCRAHRSQGRGDLGAVGRIGHRGRVLDAAPAHAA